MAALAIAFVVGDYYVLGPLVSSSVFRVNPRGGFPLRDLRWAVPLALLYALAWPIAVVLFASSLFNKTSPEDERLHARRIVQQLAAIVLGLVVLLAINTRLD